MTMATQFSIADKIRAELHELSVTYEVKRNRLRAALAEVEGKHPYFASHKTHLANPEYQDVKRAACGANGRNPDSPARQKNLKRDPLLVDCRNCIKRVERGDFGKELQARLVRR